jgi:hypothetical protein
MRSQVAILVCAVVLVACTILRPSTPVAAQDCGSCVPFRNVNIEMSGAYHACFDANSFSGEQADKIA